jgi:hypothetical protein
MAANEFPTTGGEEAHPIDDLQDIEDAVAYANEALDAAQRLEEGQLTDSTDAVAQKLLAHAVESYIEKFKIPMIALEDSTELAIREAQGSAQDDSHSDATQASRLKKVVLYLYAAVQRIFKAIFDMMRNQKATARRLMPLTKLYIGQADSLSSSVASHLNVKDRSLMVALQIDGIVPRKTPELFDALADSFEKQHPFAAVSEVVRLISAAKDENKERVMVSAGELRARLEEGFKKTMTVVADPQKLSIFSEKKSAVASYYVSEPLFGHNYIYGIVGTDVQTDGTFRYKCGIQRDAEVPLRVGAFPVLTPDEIRAICRTALRVCENIIRFSRDEELLQKALREVSFLTTKEADQNTIAALRNFSNVGQNSYIVYLRFVTRTMQALLRWCAVSINRYEGVTKS